MDHPQTQSEKQPSSAGFHGGRSSWMRKRFSRVPLLYSGGGVGANPGEVPPHPQPLSPAGRGEIDRGEILRLRRCPPLESEDRRRHRQENPPMSIWTSLLKKPTSLRGSDALDDWFDRIARQLLAGSRVMVGNGPHRFVE